MNTSKYEFLSVTTCNFYSGNLSTLLFVSSCLGLSTFTKPYNSYLFHRTFLPQLEQCSNDHLALANCFVSHASQLEMYVTYCTYQAKSDSVFKEYCGFFAVSVTSLLPVYVTSLLPVYVSSLLPVYVTLLRICMFTQ